MPIDNQKLTKYQRLDIILRLLDHKKTITDRAFTLIAAFCAVLAFSVSNASTSSDNLLFFCIGIIALSCLAIGIMFWMDTCTLEKTLNLVVKQEDVSEQNLLPLFKDVSGSVLTISLFSLAFVLLLIIFAYFWLSRMIAYFTLLLIIIHIIKRSTWGKVWIAEKRNELMNLIFSLGSRKNQQ